MGSLITCTFSLVEIVVTHRFEQPEILKGGKPMGFLETVRHQITQIK